MWKIKSSNEGVQIKPACIPSKIILQNVKLPPSLSLYNWILIDGNQKPPGDQQKTFNLAVLKKFTIELEKKLRIKRLFNINSGRFSCI